MDERLAHCPAVSQHDAIEECKETYYKMARDVYKAGKELPIVDVPAELGDAAFDSVESGDTLLKKARVQQFYLPFEMKDGVIIK